MTYPAVYDEAAERVLVEAMAAASATDRRVLLEVGEVLERLRQRLEERGD